MTSYPGVSILIVAVCFPAMAMLFARAQIGPSSGYEGVGGVTLARLLVFCDAEWFSTPAQYVVPQIRADMPIYIADAGIKPATGFFTSRLDGRQVLVIEHEAAE